MGSFWEIGIGEGVEIAKSEGEGDFVLGGRNLSYFRTRHMQIQITHLPNPLKFREFNLVHPHNPSIPIPNPTSNTFTQTGSDTDPDSPGLKYNTFTGRT